MILTPLELADRYVQCHPELAEGLAFLRRADLATLADGKHEIVGDRVFAIIAHDSGKGTADAILESHRRYIDIQFLVSGYEVIGWHPLDKCSHIQQPYDSQRDIAFYSDRPTCWFELAQNNCAIFFPEDAHAPLAGTGIVHKVVIKVAT